MIQLPASVLAIALALCGIFAFGVRVWLKTFIESRVKVTVDIQTEEIRSQLRNSEERLKSNLRNREAEISVLRDGALSGRASRAAQIDKRRLAAVDHLWDAVLKLSSLQGPALTLSMLKLDAVAKEVPENENLREMLEMMMLVKDFEETISGLRAEVERPYVEEPLWSAYSAYSSVIIGSWAIMKMLTIGIKDANQFVKLDHMKNVLKAALPHRAKVIDEGDVTSHYHFLDEIKQNILVEIKRELDGERADGEALKKAATIMDAVKKVERDASEISNTPASSEKF
ncbi:MULTISPECIES: hypothetical protein [unclassified Sphingopyxis]|uniref:hypothetical protein n=1 Tax=unclassified Sphingopyxis TaxID=2614943 RepID=UPI0012E37AA4|nr:MULTISPECIES: hypothetical protein [unclassified Sphingopyxis]